MQYGVLACIWAAVGQQLGSEAISIEEEERSKGKSKGLC